MGRGLQRALNVGPWRENALMVDMTTNPLFLSLSCAAANERSPTQTRPPPDKFDGRGPSMLIVQPWLSFLFGSYQGASEALNKSEPCFALPRS
jgi:hypothetical protein